MENQWPGETPNSVTATTQLRSTAATGASSTPGSAPGSSSTGMLWRSIFPAAPATTHEASQLYVKQNAPPRARTQAMALPGSLGPGLDFSLQVFIGVCCFFETINSKKFSFQDSWWRSSDLDFVISDIFTVQPKMYFKNLQFLEGDS